MYVNGVAMRPQDYVCPECGRRWSGWIVESKDDKEKLCRDCEHKKVEK